MDKCFESADAGGNLLLPTECNNTKVQETCQPC